MKAQSRPTLVAQEPLPNKTIWSFQGLNLIMLKISKVSQKLNNFL
jgi:hypothetical protein